MAAIFTVDASVFVNAWTPGEAGQRQSHRLLTRFYEEATPIVAPTLLLVEVAAAIARGHGDAALARSFAETLSRLPHLVLLPLDDLLAHQATEIASSYRLRGADAVYVAVARRFASTLVTRDEEQARRASPVIKTASPATLL